MEIPPFKGGGVNLQRKRVNSDPSLISPPDPKVLCPTPIDNELRTKNVIRNDLLSKHRAVKQLNEATKELMVDFAYEAFIYLNERENDEASLSIKMEKGFRSMNANMEKMVERIVSLEKAQTEGNARGADKIEKIDERCRQLQEATIPSEAAVTFAQMTKKILPKQQSDTVIPRSEPAIETKNRFLVLETEPGWKVKTEDHLAQAKKEIAKVFRGRRIRTQRIVKTGAGNVSVEFDDLPNQQMAGQMLSDKPPAHMRLRIAKEPLIHLAMRGVPSDLTETDLKAQLQDRNEEEFPIFNDPTKYTLRTGDRTSMNRRTRTWKLSVPRDDAVRMVRQKRLFLEIESVHVDLWAPGHKRCTTCFSLDHKSNHPTKCMKPICNICAGNHMNRDCRKINKVEDHKCYVCALLKLDSNHCATTKDCPTLGREALNEAKKASASLYG